MDWQKHKHDCKWFVKSANEICKVLVRKWYVMNPWGVFLSDLIEDEPSPVPGVYAEYDPRTFAFRGFGSTLNLEKTLEEKRIHNDGKFYQIFSLEGLVGNPQFFEDVLEPAYYIVFLNSTSLLPPLALSSSKKHKALGFVRAIEGALTKTYTGNREDSFKLFREQFDPIQLP
jgi:hypothetical protein